MHLLHGAHGLGAATQRRADRRQRGVLARQPLLNPAVIVFLALVAPWEWVATRVAVGAALVVGGAALVARLTDRRVDPDDADAVAAVSPASGEGGAVRRFLTTLGRTSAVVVQEYLLVVLVGSFSGWLFPLGESAQSWGLLAPSPPCCSAPCS